MTTPRPISHCNKPSYLAQQPSQVAFHHGFYAEQQAFYDFMTRLMHRTMRLKHPQGFHELDLNRAIDAMPLLASWSPQSIDAMKNQLIALAVQQPSLTAHHPQTMGESSPHATAGASQRA